jgi:hypothetical protein
MKHELAKIVRRKRSMRFVDRVERIRPGYVYLERPGADEFVEF